MAGCNSTWARGRLPPARDGAEAREEGEAGLEEAFLVDEDKDLTVREAHSGERPEEEEEEAEREGVSERARLWPRAPVLVPLGVRERPL